MRASEARRPHVLAARPLLVFSWFDVHKAPPTKPRAQAKPEETSLKEVLAAACRGTDVRTF